MKIILFYLQKGKIVHPPLYLILLSAIASTLLQKCTSLFVKLINFDGVHSALTFGYQGDHAVKLQLNINIKIRNKTLIKANLNHLQQIMSPR